MNITPTYTSTLVMVVTPCHIPCAWPIAAIAANRHQPMTSSTAAQVSAIAPGRRGHAQPPTAKNVLHGRTGRRHRAEPRVQQIALDEDAREHRKSGDRHRRAEKTGEAETRHAGSSPRGREG